MKKIYIITGGTVNYIRPHLALSAPAYGQVGLDIFNEICDCKGSEEYDIRLVPTNMALSVIIEEYMQLTHYMKLIRDCEIEKLETNSDMSKLIDHLISLEDTRCIIMSCAICDFEAEWVRNHDDINMDRCYMPGDFDIGKQHPRLSSSKEYEIGFVPSEKILSKIRQKRKDVFLVSFKTTSNAGRDETYKQGLISLKKNSSNLVFANDISEKINMIVTPEEYPYENDTRSGAVEILCNMLMSRLNLTFEDRTVIKDEKRAFPVELYTDNLIPENWFFVMKYLFDNGAFKPLPGTGKTSGHFACKVKNRDYVRITSERKIDHNQSFERGMIPVYSYSNNELVVGGAKPSVGEKTQEMIYQKLGDDIHSIVHFHCPLRDNVDTSKIPVREQFPYECGSLQCALNTSDGMEEVEQGIWAVHLNNHGPNIAFHKSVPTESIIAFIEKYWNLSDKTGGIVI